jgi:Flp pilus assembly protein TadG
MFSRRRHCLRSSPKKRGIAAIFLPNKDGVAAVEFALIAAPFMALILAILQTAVVFFAGQVLETAVEDTSRLIMTGQVQTDTQAQFAATVCTKVFGLFNCNNLMVDVESVSSFASANTSAPTLTFNSSGQVTNTWQYNPGTSGSIVVMRVMYQWPVFLGPLGFSLANLSNGKRLLMATAVFQNEVF